MNLTKTQQRAMKEIINESCEQKKKHTAASKREHQVELS